MKEHWNLKPTLKLVHWFYGMDNEMGETYWWCVAPMPPEMLRELLRVACSRKSPDWAAGNKNGQFLPRPDFLMVGTVDMTWDTGILASCALWQCLDQNTRPVSTYTTAQPPPVPNCCKECQGGGDRRPCLGVFHLVWSTSREKAYHKSGFDFHFYLKLFPHSVLKRNLYAVCRKQPLFSRV